MNRNFCIFAGRKWNSACTAILAELLPSFSVVFFIMQRFSISIIRGWSERTDEFVRVACECFVHSGPSDRNETGFSQTLSERISKSLKLFEKDLLNQPVGLPRIQGDVDCFTWIESAFVEGYSRRFMSNEFSEDATLAQTINGIMLAIRSNSRFKPVTSGVVHAYALGARHQLSFQFVVAFTADW